MTDAIRQPTWFDENNALDLPGGFEWTPQEQWAWAHVLRGDEADLGLFDPAQPRENFAVWYAGKDDGAGTDANALDENGVLKPWPHSRVLRDVFLRLILFQQPYSGTPARARALFRRARIDDALDWSAQRYRGDLRFLDSRFAGRVIWQGLRIDGLLSLIGSRLNADVRADGLETGGSLFCRGGFTAKGALRLLAAKIGANAEFTAATLDSGLNADGLQTAGGLYFREGFTAKGPIRLIGAKVGGAADFTDATLEGELLAEGAEIAGDLFIRKMTRLGNAGFRRVRVGGDMQLWNSKIEGVVDLTGAHIDGELQTAQDERWPVWGEGARLVLRNAWLGALAGGAGSFPLKAGKDKSPPMDLAGLSYERLGGLKAATGGSLAKDKVEALKTWLAAGHAKNDYTPGPYRTLANALVEAGQAREANEILHAMHRHEANCERNVWRWLQLAASGAFIGFGYRNWFGIVWFLLLVAAGAAYGLYLTNFHPLDVSFANFNEFRRWLGFSFGNAIPLVTLDKAHETFLAVRFVGVEPNDVQKVPIGIAWAFYIQKVAGFIILSYLAAGVTGLASRQKD